MSPLSGRDVAHVAEERARERSRDVGAHLVLELPEREASDRQEAARRRSAEARLTRVAAELDLLGRGGGVEERDHAVRRYAEQREAAVGRRSAREEAAEVDDLRVVLELGARGLDVADGVGPEFDVAAELSSSPCQSFP